VRADPDEPVAGGDPAAALAQVRALALARFPRERRTLELFFAELERQQRGEAAGAEGGTVVPYGAADGAARLEELLEALLVGEAHGLARR
jgi:hypothetical protein